jgi:hypothetical protein
MNGGFATLHGTAYVGFVGLFGDANSTNSGAFFYGRLRFFQSHWRLFLDLTSGEFLTHHRKAHFRLYIRCFIEQQGEIYATGG